MAKESVGRTLVIQPLPGIGDMVWHRAHLKAIASRSPDKKVSILTKSRSKVGDLLGHEPFIDEIITFDHRTMRNRQISSLFAMVREIKKHHFHEVWILHHSTRYALAAFLANVPVRFGYGYSWQKYLLNSKRFLPKNLRNIAPIEKADRFISLYDLRIKDADRNLSVSSNATKAVADRFQKFQRPWICFGIGSSEPVKIWSSENYANLARRLQDLDRYTVFLLGSEEESDIATQIMDLAQGADKRVVAVTDLPLDQTCALIKECQFYIGSDNGLLNVAACLGVPTFGLFAVTPPLDYQPNIYPIKPPADAVKQMSSITVDAVEKFITEKISKTGR